MDVNLQLSNIDLKKPFITTSESHTSSKRKLIAASDLIKQARLNSRLTQSQLAHLSGETQSVLSAYERGRRQPSFEAVVKILMAAGTYLVSHNSKTTKTNIKRRGEKLEQVLELASAFPSKASSHELKMPRL